MPPRLCLECGRPTQGSRCPAHVKGWSGKPTRPEYRGDWPAISRRVRQQWVQEHGWWCPGDEAHGPHPSHDLSTDHILPVSKGGTHARSNLRVLCRSANTRRAVVGPRTRMYK